MLSQFLSRVCIYDYFAVGVESKVEWYGVSNEIIGCLIVTVEKCSDHFNNIRRSIRRKMVAQLVVGID